MTFTKEQIKQAKQGVHYLKLSPHETVKREYTVAKVRGDIVYLKGFCHTEAGWQEEVFAINKTCSLKLMFGDYRPSMTPAERDEIKQSLMKQLNAGVLYAERGAYRGAYEAGCKSCYVTLFGREWDGLIKLARDCGHLNAFMSGRDDEMDRIALAWEVKQEAKAQAREKRHFRSQDD